MFLLLWKKMPVNLKSKKWFDKIGQYYNDNTKFFIVYCKITMAGNAVSYYTVTALVLP